MQHLNDDELYELAKVETEYLLYTPSQLTQLDHLKNCPECYQTYRHYTALMEATSEVGYAAIADIFQISPADFEEESFSEKILASFRVVTAYLSDKITSTIEQLNADLSMYMFEPVPGLATRGPSGQPSATVKLENIENEKTFLMYDPVEEKLLIQIDLSDLNTPDIQVYLVMLDGTVRPVELVKKGRFLQGFAEHVEDTEFDVIIEEQQ